MDDDYDLIGDGDYDLWSISSEEVKADTTVTLGAVHGLGGATSTPRARAAAAAASAAPLSLSPCLRRAITLATAACESESDSESTALEQVALLLPVLQSSKHASSVACLQRCLRAFANAVVVDATSARVAVAHTYTASGHLLFHSRRRTDALVLHGLLQLDRQADALRQASATGVMALLPKLASNLLDQRRNGHWYAHATARLDS